MSRFNFEPINFAPINFELINFEPLNFDPINFELINLNHIKSRFDRCTSTEYCFRMSSELIRLRWFCIQKVTQTANAAHWGPGLLGSPK